MNQYVKRNLRTPEVQKPETVQKTGSQTNRKFLWMNQYENTNLPALEFFRQDQPCSNGTKVPPPPTTTTTKQFYRSRKKNLRDQKYRRSDLHFKNQVSNTLLHILFSNINEYFHFILIDQKIPLGMMRLDLSAYAHSTS